MPAHAPTGIKGHKTERLGLGHVDHLPDINTHRAVNDLQFVNQCDVDAAEDILGQLDGSSGCSRGDRHRFDDE